MRRQSAVKSAGKAQSKAQVSRMAPSESGTSRITFDDNESSLAIRFLLDHSRIIDYRQASTRPPTDTRLLSGHRLTPDFCPTTK
ncbi:hypothetical protein MA16_Dca007532 [Dendrobium catenatum]|uniref:Uncharacterized protein n=1 Tax=Dendrobium catenatum TaxID=906689 RepID=A0A2I0WBD8_9ASPA|nr:hypothetical protein MA16_Dca007532 [Dendrobium catenatum]